MTQSYFKCENQAWKQGSHTPLEFKPVTSELLGAVLELDQCALGGLWTSESYQREIDSPNSDLLVLSLPVASPLRLVGLGCLWAILEEAHITLLGIHPDYWGQGLGQAMLYGLLRCAWRRKLEWATLEVRVSNQPAVSLYKKFGFEEVGRRRRYYKDTGEDALILWRSGLHQPEFEEILGQWEQEVSDRLAVSGWDLLPLSASIAQTNSLPTRDLSPL